MGEQSETCYNFKKTHDIDNHLGNLFKCLLKI